MGTNEKCKSLIVRNIVGRIEGNAMCESTLKSFVGRRGIHGRHCPGCGNRYSPGMSDPDDGTINKMYGNNIIVV